MVTQHSVYIGGICGSFMTGLARIASEAGYRVGGCDKDCYPPMSEQLARLGVHFDSGLLMPKQEWDSYVIGNALSRGNDFVETILNQRLAFDSGPSWLYKEILRHRKVLCVAGTHGKTTTSSILAWILDFAGMQPGFLVGGVARNFAISSRLGDSDFFVIEGDEYDTAFFDKRSKFIHYHPHIVILNNLEFDHADIFTDIEAIKTQFHHLMRTIPSEGLAVVRAGDEALQDVLERGCWCDVETFGLIDESAHWQVRCVDEGQFEVLYRQQSQGFGKWDMKGKHNILNALAAIAVGHRIGVKPAVAIEALATFSGVSRRLEMVGQYEDVVIYDDFAHHPTEIKASISALKSDDSNRRVIAVVEPRSNSMKLGCHQADMPDALRAADKVFFYVPPDIQWDVDEVFDKQTQHISAHRDIDLMIEAIVTEIGPTDRVLVMSNGDFQNVCQRLDTLLAKRGMV